MNEALRLALKEYDGSSRNFRDDFMRYLAYGYVYSGEDVFILARPIDLAHADKWDDFDFKHKNPDCWFVFLAAGQNKLSRFQELAPFTLPKVGWHRGTDNKLRTYDWTRFSNRTRQWARPK